MYAATQKKYVKKGNSKPLQYHPLDNRSVTNNSLFKL